MMVNSQRDYEKDFAPIVQSLLAAIRQIEIDSLYAREASAIAEELLSSKALAGSIRLAFQDDESETK